MEDDSTKTALNKCILTTKNPTCLGYLFQTNPKIVNDSNFNFLLCSIMPYVILQMPNAISFAGACKYTHELLLSFKENPEAFSSFLNLSATKEYLTKACYNSRDEVAIPSIDLLTVLTVYQVSSYLIIHLKRDIYIVVL